MNQKQKQMLDMLYDEPYRLGHMTGFKDLTPLHNEWLRSFLYGKKDQTKLAHRGSYKTTIDALFLAIHAILLPNENVIFFRKTDNDVGEVITTAVNILQTGAVQEIVRTLYGADLRLLKATQSEINTNLNTSVKGQSQVLGLGIGTSVTGKHADIIVTDDIVNLKDRISRAERDRTKIMYQELQNVKNRGGRFINTGTPWHKEDAISMMPNIERFDCYTTGLISREELKEIRKNMSDSLFAANYELKHIADEDAMFKDPNFESNADLIHGGRGHIDAAYGGGDYTAYTEFKALEDGRIIGYGMLMHKHVDDCLTRILGAHEVHRIGSISCETNGDKGYLAKELSEHGIPVRKYAERANKFIKISSYLRKNWENIYWLDDTDPEYLAQVIDYTENAEHDDAPDSAASLLREMEKQEFATVTTIKGGL